MWAHAKTSQVPTSHGDVTPLYQLTGPPHAPWPSSHPTSIFPLVVSKPFIRSHLRAPLTWPHSCDTEGIMCLWAQEWVDTHWHLMLILHFQLWNTSPEYYRLCSPSSQNWGNKEGTGSSLCFIQKTRGLRRTWFNIMRKASFLFCEVIELQNHSYSRPIDYPKWTQYQRLEWGREALNLLHDNSVFYSRTTWNWTTAAFHLFSGKTLKGKFHSGQKFGKCSWSYIFLGRSSGHCIIMYYCVLLYLIA